MIYQGFFFINGQKVAINNTGQSENPVVGSV